MLTRAHTQSRSMILFSCFVDLQELTSADLYFADDMDSPIFMIYFAVVYGIWGDCFHIVGKLLLSVDSRQHISIARPVVNLLSLM